MRIAVAGATSWGLTLAWLVSDAVEFVDVYARDANEAETIDKARGIPRLPALTLPNNVRVTHPPVSECDGLIVAVPSRFVRDFVPRLRVPPSTSVLSATKGLEPGTNSRISEILDGFGFRDVAVLSGPNLAGEVTRGLPAASVVASPSQSAAERWQRLLATRTFRTYRAEDVVGVELGGALKNVVAIAAGAASGMGFGANTVATIVTRGLAEMTRLGVAMGAQPETFRGLAGVGDLTATCFSPLSRNHQFGALVARGETPADALGKVGQAVEGIAAAEVAVRLGQELSVDVPIAEQVHEVLAGRLDVPAAMAALLSRSLKAEAD